MAEAARTAAEMPEMMRKMTRMTSHGRQPTLLRAKSPSELTISELAVQAVRPRVVWALDDARADRGEVAGEQLVAAVPARVEEPAQDAVLTAHQHDALRPNANGTLIRGVGQIGRAPFGFLFSE